MMLNQHIARCEEQQQEVNSPTFTTILDRLREIFYSVRIAFNSCRCRSSFASVACAFSLTNTAGCFQEHFTNKRRSLLNHCRKNSLKLIELSSINKVSLYVSSCSNIGSIRIDCYWTSRENSLELSSRNRAIQ